MASRFLIICALAAAVSVSACKSDSTPTAPSANVPFSATDLRVGTGAEAVAGRVATVSYSLWLYDANASQNKGQAYQPGTFSFTLGGNQVIPGFNQAVVGMRVGGQRRAVIPPNLAYGAAGAAGNPPIPGNATLVFEVELLNIQ
jgi:FKBP-type peptidyl-prolyl cis-trans isomerase FkpA